MSNAKFNEDPKIDKYDDVEGTKGSSSLPFLTPASPSSNVNPSAPEYDNHEEWTKDLSRLDYEIRTLRTVLVAKNQEAAVLKQKLGITPMDEIKQDVQYGIDTIKGSGAYQKTNSALKTVGDYASKKMVDIRNSNAFKSVEEKVGGAYTSVKQTVVASRSQGDFKQSQPERANEKEFPDENKKQ